MEEGMEMESLDCIRVVGGHKLRGSIPISGAKNAVLPLMVLSLLTEHPVIIENVPLLADVETMKALLRVLGTKVEEYPQKLVLRTANLESFSAPYEIVRKMRASILTLGPLIARAGRAKVSLPGGCEIGLRLVNWHLEGLQALGVDIDVVNGYICAEGRVKGGSYTFPRISVTGTQNLLFAACLSKGETRLNNIAQEPEVTFLVSCLRKMGAVVEYDGPSTLLIQGVEKLNGLSCVTPPDRVEMGTYMMAAAITQGDVILEEADLSLLPTIVPILQKSGVSIEEIQPRRVRVSATSRPEPFVVSTSPFPGFSTDLQAQIMALASIAQGSSFITENIYENRFMHVSELNRMGASISVDKSCATVVGKKFLSGAHVMATDLRASVSLIIAALVAQGETFIQRIHHLDRGYESLEKKLSACGAEVCRMVYDDAYKNSMTRDRFSVILGGGNV